MKKFRIILASSGHSVQWGAEDIQEIKKALQEGKRTITPPTGNTAFPLTLQNTIIEEIE